MTTDSILSWRAVDQFRFDPYDTPTCYHEPTRAGIIEQCLAVQSKLIAQIDTHALDMRNYHTALTPNEQDSELSRESKHAIQALWDTHFEAIPTSMPEIDYLPNQSPLNIVIIGAGIAGSTAYSRLIQLKAPTETQQGHRLTLLEKRDHPPARENPVTIDQDSRDILNTIPTCANRLFQTNGDMGCSERASLMDIESSLLEAKSDSAQVLRGCSDIEVQYDSNAMSGSVKYTLKDEKQTIDSADLIIVATGASSGNPFNDNETPIVNQHFKMIPGGKELGAVAYCKYHYPVQSEEEVPLQCEKDIILMDDNTGKTITNQWINLYQGRRTYRTASGEVSGYENSLIMDIPVKVCKLGQEAKTQYLSNRLSKLLKHPEPEIQKVAQSYFRNRSTHNTSTEDEEKVIGTAMVSHWYAASSEDHEHRVVGIGDVMCPPHPWTGSGSNLAIQSTTPLLELTHRLSRIKATECSLEKSAAYRKLAFTHFDQAVSPYIYKSILRGSFSSQIFDKIERESV